MDFDEIYTSAQSELITTPDNEKYLFSGKDHADIIRDYTAVARQFVNDEYADSLERYLNSVIDDARDRCNFCEYYDELIALQSNQVDCETSSDELLNVIDDVRDLLKKYELRYSRKLRLNRLDVEPLLKELHQIVDDYE